MKLQNKCSVCGSLQPIPRKGVLVPEVKLRELQGKLRRYELAPVVQINEKGVCMVIDDRFEQGVAGATGPCRLVSFPTLEKRERSNDLTQ